MARLLRCWIPASNPHLPPETCSTTHLYVSHSSLQPSHCSMLQIPRIQWWQRGSATSPSHWCMPFQMHTLKMTWHINGCAMLSRWWRHMSSLSTPIVVSDSPIPIFTPEADDVEWWRHMTDTYKGQQLGEQHEFPPPCFSIYQAGATLPSAMWQTTDKLLRYALTPYVHPFLVATLLTNQSCIFFGSQHSAPPPTCSALTLWVVSYVSHHGPIVMGHPALTASHVTRVQPVWPVW